MGADATKPLRNICDLYSLVNLVDRHTNKFLSSSSFRGRHRRGYSKHRKMRSAGQFGKHKTRATIENNMWKERYLRIRDYIIPQMLRENEMLPPEMQRDPEEIIRDQWLNLTNDRIQWMREHKGMHMAYLEHPNPQPSFQQPLPSSATTTTTETTTPPSSQQSSVINLLPPSNAPPPPSSQQSTALSIVTPPSSTAGAPSMLRRLVRWAGFARGKHRSYSRRRHRRYRHYYKPY